MTIQHYTACDHLDLADADLVSLDGVSHPERAASSNPMRHHTIAADAARGRMCWGPQPLPHGHMIIGTVNILGALIINPARSCYAGNAGALSSLPESVLTDWVRDLRSRRGLDAVLAASGASRRTWEGYEQGRPIPIATIYALTIE